MITDHQEEFASLYAFGLLEGQEKIAFEAELAATPELRALTAQLAATAGELALTAPAVTPPAALKARVLAAVDAVSHESTPAAGHANVLAFPFARLIPWAAAAAFAVTAAWFASQTFVLRSENAELRGEKQLAEVAYQMAQNKLSERSLLAEQMITDLGKKLQRTEDLARLKVTALASLAGNTTEAKVIAVWDPEQQAGLLTMEKLPAISDTQDYQIWIVDPAYKNPVNGGVFHVAADGTIPPLKFAPDQPVTQVAAFAISLEKKGGVPKAEGPIVLLGK